VEGEPLSLRDAERSVTYLWGAYWSGRYDQLTGLVPQALIGLRAMLHAADAANRPKAAEQLAWGYWVAGSTLTRQSLDRNGEGLAVTRQEEDCVKLCRDRDWTVVPDPLTGKVAVSDNDISASNGKPRPGLVWRDLREAPLAADVEPTELHNDLVCRISRVERASLPRYAVVARASTTSDTHLACGTDLCLLTSLARTAAHRASASALVRPS